MNDDFFRKMAEIKDRIPQIIKRVPGVARVEGLRFISDNFKKKGFQKAEGSVEKWKPKKKKGSKQVLIGEKRGGSLKKSWVGETTESTAEFSSSLPYAAVHNEGLLAGRKPGFIMPERRMIGPSEMLNNMIETKVDKLVDEVFKP